ncbi:hypothetical protein K491DRAFT_719882 [Lophiostoma macrostomum CBS 122681]|uniref:Integral membrane protein-like protein n=1 Tax=Lophiostoma macrostomum CBS 122681 TaxID=1314788 RepID=A0A6A6SUF9_9PLEO|nr:hypothetical protein K491DRAFT_719882 [Lophiostoma macrostomum CBS 122681]
MVLRWYRAKLAARPYLVQSTTTMVLLATGDILAQQGIERHGAKGHDLARTGRMALYGGFVFGPAATAWYGFLSRRVTLHGKPNGLPTICTRVALDQLTFTPVNLACFLTTMAYLEKSSPQQRLQSVFWHALTKNWTI